MSDILVSNGTDSSSIVIVEFILFTITRPSHWEVMVIYIVIVEIPGMFAFDKSE